MEEMTELAEKLKGTCNEVVEAALKRWEGLKSRALYKQNFESIKGSARGSINKTISSYLNQT